MVMNEVYYINKVNEKSKPKEQLRTIVFTLNIGNRCTKNKGSVNLINFPKELGTEMQRF